MVFASISSTYQLQIAHQIAVTQATILIITLMYSSQEFKKEIGF